MNDIYKELMSKLSFWENTNPTKCKICGRACNGVCVYTIAKDVLQENRIRRLFPDAGTYKLSNSWWIAKLDTATFGEWEAGRLTGEEAKKQVEERNGVEMTMIQFKRLAFHCGFKK